MTTSDTDAVPGAGTPVDVFVVAPLAGDGRDGRRNRGGWDPADQPAALAPVTDDRPGRFTHSSYLRQVARAVQATGLRGLVLPDLPDGEDPWVLAAALARRAPLIDVVTELSPSLGNPVYAAKMAATFQRFTAGRQRWHLRLGGAPGDRAIGDTAETEVLLARAAEFLTIARGVWAGGPFDLDGRFFSVTGGGFDPKLTKDGFPVVHLSGTDDATLRLSAAHGDVHVLDLAEGAELERTFATLDDHAAAEGRRVRHGLRLTIVARDTEDEARAAAGAAAATTLVGTYDEVADRLQALVDAGVDSFVLDARPALEETYHLGERLFPRLGRHIHLAAPAAVAV